MLRNLMEPLEKAARRLAHVSLLQGTKAYGSHVRPMKVPAREGRSEMREQPNFYWNQEDYLREKQRGKGWCFSIFRPVLIVGYSQGSAMNVIPAIGAYAAMLKEAGQPLHYPGGPPRVGQAVDADLLARCMAWAGEAAVARNETFNVANGDVYCWQNIWPAIAGALGMAPGEAVPCSLEAEILPREAEWTRIRSKHKLVSPDLKSFVGLSFQYADYQMGFGRTEPPPPSFSSTIKLMQAGFHEVMDTEVMFVKWLRAFQDAATAAAAVIPPRASNGTVRLNDVFVDERRARHIAWAQTSSDPAPRCEGAGQFSRRRRKTMTTNALPPKRRSQWYSPRSIWRSVVIRPRVYGGALVGIAILLLLPRSLSLAVQGAIAWCAGGGTYLILAYQAMRRCESDRIQSRAARQDDGAIVILAVILLAIFASFASIFGLVTEAKEASREAKLVYSNTSCCVIYFVPVVGLAVDELGCLGCLLAG